MANKGRKFDTWHLKTADETKVQVPVRIDTGSDPITFHVDLPEYAIKEWSRDVNELKRNVTEQLKTKGAIAWKDYYLISLAKPGFGEDGEDDDADEFKTDSRFSSSKKAGFEIRRIAVGTKTTGDLCWKDEEYSRQLNDGSPATVEDEYDDDQHSFVERTSQNEVAIDCLRELTNELQKHFVEILQQDRVEKTLQGYEGMPVAILSHLQKVFMAKTKVTLKSKPVKKARRKK